MNGIAHIYQEKKEYDEALKLYEESLAVGRAGQRLAKTTPRLPCC
jgi:hypothetical protein